MSEIIQISQYTKEASRRLQSGLIAPAIEAGRCDQVPDHVSEPIKDMMELIRISEHLKDGGRYRDNMLFIVGINFGLRISDLISLRFSDIITNEFTFKETFAILEKKTSSSRKYKKNRHITINRAVVEAVTLYLENTTGVRLSDYMFRSQSNRGKNQNQPISRSSADRILKDIGKELELSAKIATHSLRKTFAYHQMVMSNNDPRKLLLLQKMFGHSTSAQTLDYIGITNDEIIEAYQGLNLGSADYNYLVDSDCVETSEEVGVSA